MRRREFIALIGCAAAYPLTLHSQQPQPLRRIAYLTPAVGPNPVDEALEKSLQTLGWVRDRNIKIEFRSAEGHQDRIAPIIAEISSLGMDFVVVWSRVMAVALMRAAPQTAMVAGPLLGIEPSRAVIAGTETLVQQKHALSSASIAHRKRLGLWRLWNM